MEDLVVDIAKNHPLLSAVLFAAGFFSIIVAFLKLLGEFFPTLSAIKAQLLMPIARKWQFKALEKSAIKADICGHVNSVLMHLINEMPSGWVKKLNIQWVEKETADEFFETDKIVVRMRPLKDQDKNFVSAIYQFLQSSFFPKTKHVIPDVISESSVLHVSRRVIRSKKPRLESHFDDHILESAAQKNNKVLDYMTRYETLDQKGFFAGTFLREAHEIAQRCKLTPLRNHISAEITDLLQHLEKFGEGLTESDGLNESDWSREGKATSYRLLLVAHPHKSQRGATEGYVNRVSDAANQGIQRLYLYGTKEQKRFARRVITAIATKIPQYQLREMFELHKDYRGKDGGIGALFVKQEAEALTAAPPATPTES